MRRSKSYYLHMRETRVREIRAIYGKIVNTYNTEVHNPRRKMQVALFAEPKTPLESSMSTMSSGNEICCHCTHHEALLYATALYTFKHYISVTHARRSFTHA